MGRRNGQPFEVWNVSRALVKVQWLTRHDVRQRVLRINRLTWMRAVQRATCEQVISDQWSVLNFAVFFSSSPVIIQHFPTTFRWPRIAQSTDGQTLQKQRNRFQSVSSFVRLFGFVFCFVFSRNVLWSDYETPDAKRNCWLVSKHLKNGNYLAPKQQKQKWKK